MKELILLIIIGSIGLVFEKKAQKEEIVENPIELIQEIKMYGMDTFNSDNDN